MQVIAVARMGFLVLARIITKVRLQRVLVVVAARTAMPGPRSPPVQCVMVAGRSRRHQTDVVRVLLVGVGGSGGGGGGIVVVGVMGRMVVLVVTLGSEVRMAVAGR